MDPTSAEGPSVDHQRHLVGSAHRGIVARPAGALRPTRDRVESFLPLAARWHLGRPLCGGAGAGGQQRQPGLGRTLRRWDLAPCPPARGGGQKGDPETEALGWSRGGFTTKVHILAKGHGKLTTLVSTPGQQHEATTFETLMEQGAAKRRGRGRPRLRPKRVVGDRGYSARRIRAFARRRGIRITIPRRPDEHRHGPFDEAMYRQRNRVERLIGLMKRNCRLATRYEKRAANYRRSGSWLLLSIGCSLQTGPSLPLPLASWRYTVPVRKATGLIPTFSYVRRAVVLATVGGRSARCSAIVVLGFSGKCAPGGVSRGILPQIHSRCDCPGECRNLTARQLHAILTTVGSSTVNRGGLDGTSSQARLA
jgi:transposase